MSVETANARLKTEEWLVDLAKITQPHHVRVLAKFAIKQRKFLFSSLKNSADLARELANASREISQLKRQLAELKTQPIRYKTPA